MKKSKKSRSVGVQGAGWGLVKVTVGRMQDEAQINCKFARLKMQFAMLGIGQFDAPSHPATTTTRTHFRSLHQKCSPVLSPAAPAQRRGHVFAPPLALFRQAQQQVMSCSSVTRTASPP
jgi:hypothetical protein